jgi:hypothetical protein
MPTGVYLEGYAVGQTSVKLTYYPAGMSGPQFSDSAIVCVMDTVFSKCDKTTYGYDDGKVDDLPVPTPKDFNPLTPGTNPGGQNAQLYDWVNVAAKAAPNAPQVLEEKTYLTLTILPVAYKEYVYINSGGPVKVSPAKAANATQEVLVEGTTLSGLTKIYTRLGSERGAYGGKINAGVYKAIASERQWITANRPNQNLCDVAAANAKIDGANTLLKQVLIKIENKAAPIVNNDVMYDDPDSGGNGNGFLDVPAATADPNKEVALAAGLTFPCTWAQLDGMIIYVSAIKSPAGPVGGLHVAAGGASVIFLSPGASNVPKGTSLAHEVGHSGNLRDVESNFDTKTGLPANNKHNVMVPDNYVTPGKDCFGYFRVMTKLGTLQEQWNTIAR